MKWTLGVYLSCEIENVFSISAFLPTIATLSSACLVTEAVHLGPISQRDLSPDLGLNLRLWS